MGPQKYYIFIVLYCTFCTKFLIVSRWANYTWAAHRWPLKLFSLVFEIEEIKSIVSIKIAVFIFAHLLFVI